MTGGAHRLWAHRSYKAKLPLQLLLMFCYSVSGQVWTKTNFYLNFCINKTQPYRKLIRASSMGGSSDIHQGVLVE